MPSFTYRAPTSRQCMGHFGAPYMHADSHWAPPFFPTYRGSHGHATSIDFIASVYLRGYGGWNGNFGGQQFGIASSTGSSCRRAAAPISDDSGGAASNICNSGSSSSPAWRPCHISEINVAATSLAHIASTAVDALTTYYHS